MQLNLNKNGVYLCVMSEQRPTFDTFLGYFKEQELPVALTEESLSEFQQINDPLPIPVIHAYLLGEDEELDAFSEIVPCFKIPETHDFHAVVCWKGELMKYQFFLVTFDNKGNPIASAAIAGIASDGKTVLRSVATIEPDWNIYIVEGEQEATGDMYAPTQSTAHQMELLPTGEITIKED